DVAQARRLVLAAREHELAIGTEDHRSHLTRTRKGVRVPQEAVELFAGLDVPQPRCLVLAARDDPFAIRAEGHASHPKGMSLEAVALPAGRHIPQPRCRVR